MTNEAFAKWMKARTKKLAKEVIEFLNTIKPTPALSTIRFQLIKSITSTAANYRAVCRGRSDNEFYAKLCIVVEEADESLFWLELIQDLKYGSQKILEYLLKETEEVLSILVKAKQTAKNKKDKK